MTQLARRLGVFDATLIVMGGIIGSGIFMTPSVVAAAARSTPLILAAWIAGALIAVAGALVFAELAWRRSDVQGMYGYLRDAFHPVLAFSFGWTALLVTQTGGMAASAVTFAVYFTPLTGLHVAQPYVAIAAVVVLNAINALGVREGGTTQNVLMIFKAAAIGGIIAVGLFGNAHAPAHAASPLPSGNAVLALFGAALISVLFSYDGWQTAAFLDGELQQPRKSLPRALVLGMLGVVALYVLVTVAGLRVLGAGGLASSTAAASDMLRAAFGSAGARAVAAAIAVSTLGFLSNSVLTTPRIFYAMSQDGIFFRQFAWLHPKTRVPVYSLVLQCIVTAIITLSGRYDQILSYVVSMDFFFMALCAIALLVFRRRDGARLQPWLTLAFAAVSFAIVADSFFTSPRETAIGFAILLSGLPVYALWTRKTKPIAGAGHA